MYTSEALSEYVEPVSITVVERWNTQALYLWEIYTFAISNQRVE